MWFLKLSIKNIHLFYHMRCACIHSFIHSFIHLFINSCIHSFIPPFFQSFIPIYIVMRSFAHSHTRMRITRTKVRLKKCFISIKIISQLLKLLIQLKSICFSCLSPSVSLPHFLVLFRSLGSPSLLFLSHYPSSSHHSLSSIFLTSIPFPVSI